MDQDLALALQLQSEFFQDDQTVENGNNFHRNSQSHEPKSLIDPFWEMTDPTPDIRALFLQFNDTFFWGRLSGIEVKWSPRMTSCAGLCCYEGRGGLCSVRLSVPLLKLRPRKDLVETLLHEMIHAYLFVTDNNKDHDGHGPEFHKHMYRINGEAGTKISVYHNFHDEVDSYRQHWWRCDGPCRSRKPYFGYVKRSMNRAPSKNDTWWGEHQRRCGGAYTKVKEPEDYGKKKSKKEKNNTQKADKKETEKSKDKGKSMDIRIFGGNGKSLGNVRNKDKPTSIPPNFTPNIPRFPGNTNNINKPRPSATISKPNIGTTSTNWKSHNPGSFISGGRTPEKTLLPKNKPVSQGGVARFNDRKKKKPVIDFDWSDSEEDEILANLSAEAERKHSGNLSHSVNQQSGNEKVLNFSSSEDDDHDSLEKRSAGKGHSEAMLVFSSDEELEEIMCSPTECDKPATQNKLSDNSQSIGNYESAQTDHSNNIVTPQSSTSKLNIRDSCESDQISSATSSHSADDNINDVRAMLRKVWGEKQFGSDEIRRKPLHKTPVSNGNNPLKRRSDSDNTGSFILEKKLRLHDDSDVVSARPIDGELTPEKSRPEVKKVTSPIEKLFNKMRKKQSSSSHGDDKSLAATTPTITQTDIENNSAFSNAYSENGMDSESVIARSSINIYNQGTNSTAGSKYLRNDMTSSTNVQNSSKLGNLQRTTQLPGDDIHIVERTSVSSSHSLPAVEDTSQCPVCCKNVPSSTINDHLDTCLTMQAIGS